MGSLSLLQEIFPTQGSSPGLPHCRQILCQLNHQGSPRIVEWVTYLFSRGSSQPRNRTGVSCIAGNFFTSSATREAQKEVSCTLNTSFLLLHYNNYSLYITVIIVTLSDTHIYIHSLLSLV